MHALSLDKDNLGGLCFVLLSSIWAREREGERERERESGQLRGRKHDLHEASVVMLRLSYPTETVLSNKITRNSISPILQRQSQKTILRRRPKRDD